jgi:hypothetical protein
VNPSSDRAQAVDPITRLLGEYEQAVLDFEAAEHGDRAHALKTAKYMRDTAENTYAYLRGEEFDAAKLSEILGTIEFAKRFVQDASGGKLRKFDPGFVPYEQQGQQGRQGVPGGLHSEREREREYEYEYDEGRGYERGRERHQEYGQERYRERDYDRNRTHDRARDHDDHDRDRDDGRAHEGGRKRRNHHIKASVYRPKYGTGAGPPTHDQAYGVYHHRPPSSFHESDTYTSTYREVTKPAERERERGRSRSPARAHELLPDRAQEGGEEAMYGGHPSIGQGNTGGNNAGIRIKGNGRTEPPPPQAGKGHSGIPYGYRTNRGVDSWRPGA